MRKGTKLGHKDDVIRGMKLISEPYKVEGCRDYCCDVQCTFCGKIKYGAVLSDIKRQVFDGCGCQKNRTNCKRFKSFLDWCIENNQKHLIDAWDYDLNSKTPDIISYCTEEYYYFKCPENKHQSSKWKIMSLTREGKKKTVCKYCNSFAQHAIDKFGTDVLDKYWDYDKNKISPWDISHSSKTKIWIKCTKTDYHGSYDIMPISFLKGIGCPYCHGNRVHQKDSLAAYYINLYGEDFLEKYWDYNENTLDPWKVTVSTNKGYIYLKCEKHGTYKMSPSNFKKHGLPCPICVVEAATSRLEVKVATYIKDVYDFKILHEHQCSIVAKNPRTKKAMPYDNDVILPNNEHLIVEVHGSQHYYANTTWNNKRAKQARISSIEVLKDMQWRDEYKKQYALSQGYHYLAIPYTAESDSSYKTMIDEKISSIINNTKLLSPAKEAI